MNTFLERYVSKKTPILSITPVFTPLGELSVYAA